MKKPYRKMPEVIMGDFMLRTINKKDYHDMFEYGRDEEVTRYLSWGPFMKPKEAKHAIQSIFYPRWHQGLPRGYAIIDMKQQKMIGTIDFHTKPQGINGAEIGYVIHKDYWNQGIMTQALKHMIDLGFDYLNYDVLWIKHMRQNVASQKVIEKTDFKHMRTEKITIQKKDYIVDDDLLIYELTKERYHGYQQS